MLKKIKKSVSLTLRDSTAYGVPKIFRSKILFFKLLWLTFFILGSVASVYYIWEAVDNYFKYEVITKIESVYEQPMKFPTISFCSYEANAFDKKLLKSIVKKCWFNLDSSCDSNLDNYFERFKSFRGDCFRFNSGKNMSGHSISVLNSTIGGKDDSFYLEFKENLSLQLWVHQTSLPPRFNNFSNHLGNMVYVSPNSRTQLIVNKIVEKKLGLPYNPCFNDASLFPLNKTIIDYFYSLNITYKQTNCLEICYDINYIDRNPCNCSNTSLGNVWEDCFVKYEESNQTGCIFRDKLKFFGESVLNKCKEYCPLECETISYSVGFNALTGYKSTTVNVYFESLKYTLISQLPKSKEFDLISNIGGIFGLFIGVSFVTLFEIVEILIQVLLIFFQNNRIIDQ